jgi:hypothetical protein
MGRYSKCRIGVDVGGTNTDAVVMHGRKVLGFAKQTTTEPLVDCVRTAIGAAMSNANVCKYLLLAWHALPADLQGRSYIALPGWFSIALSR